MHIRWRDHNASRLGFGRGGCLLPVCVPGLRGKTRQRPRPTPAGPILSRLLDGFTARVAYARSLSEGKTVLDGYDDTAAREVHVLLGDVGNLLS